ncbi:hypothetical protein B0H13DRAFT_2273482 [Mycena leptocephala]|nr:hypothetical protein B0H13DRAFT_2273482 [Mycena leptocephala]
MSKQFKKRIQKKVHTGQRRRHRPQFWVDGYPSPDGDAGGAPNELVTCTLLPRMGIRVGGLEHGLIRKRWTHNYPFPHIRRCGQNYPKCGGPAKSECLLIYYIRGDRIQSAGESQGLIGMNQQCLFVEFQKIDVGGNLGDIHSMLSASTEVRGRRKGTRK